MTTCIVSNDHIDWENAGQNRATLTATSAGLVTFSKTEGGAGDVQIAGVADPTSDQHVATKAYVDANSSGLHIQQSVRVASTANNADLATGYANGDTVDGIVLATNDRLLVKDQTTTTENGIYVVAASGAPARASDMAAGAGNAEGGDFVFVREGSTNADTGWVISSDSTSINVSVDAMVWTQFSSAGSGFTSAGTGLTASGSTVNVIGGDGITANADDVAVDLDGATLSVSASGVKVADGGVDTTQLADNAVTVAKMAGLTAANFILGNASNDPVAVTMSGDATMDNLGAVTITANAVEGTMINSNVAGDGIEYTANTLAVQANGGAASGLTVAAGGVSVTAHPTTLGTSAPSKYVSAAATTGNVTIAGGNANMITADQLTLTELTATYVPYAGTGGLLEDDSAFNYTQGTGTLKATVMTATSDERVKKNIRTIEPEDGLEVIRKSRGVKFDWKKTGLASAGVVAQEAKKLVPELVEIAKGGEGLPDDMHSMNYAGYTGYLIAANQALLARVEALEKQVTGRKRKAGAAGGDAKRR